jgi:hypothetical protein
MSEFKIGDIVEFQLRGDGRASRWDGNNDRGPGGPYSYGEVIQSDYIRYIRVRWYAAGHPTDKSSHFLKGAAFMVRDGWVRMASNHNILPKEVRALLKKSFEQRKDILSYFCFYCGELRPCKC